MPAEHLPGEAPAAVPVVIDTNIALDLLVFGDPATAGLLAALQKGQLRWLITPAMRDELERVLGYPKLAARIRFHQCDTTSVLARADALSTCVPAALKAPVTCSDADDQKFIDLACAHLCLLLSKDRHITDMRKRLDKLGVRISDSFQALVA